MTVPTRSGLAHSTAMARLGSTTRTFVVVVAALTVASGCVPDGDDDSATAADAEAPTSSIAVPPERRTPFCAAMIDLNDRLAQDMPADDTPADDTPADDTSADDLAVIIQVYESIVDEVPPEIRDDFLTVLARLQSGDTATTTDLVDPATATSAPSTSVPTSTATDGEPSAAGASTTVPFAEEGYDPDDDPALRLNAYVQFACRDTQNNPGPPATEPGPAITTMP